MFIALLAGGDDVSLIELLFYFLLCGLLVPLLATGILLGTFMYIYSKIFPLEPEQADKSNQA